MRSSFEIPATGITISSIANPVHRVPRLLFEHPGQEYVPTPVNKSLAIKQNTLGSVIKRMNKLGKKADRFAHGIREHVRLGSKISETLKGKLSLGARIIQGGGVKKVFRQLSSVGEGEKLLKACQCYLSTTAGPIAGLLFISTEKVAFCSERSLKLASRDGKTLRVHYKVLIPLQKIKAANQTENAKRPSQEFIELVTVDNHDFWFMGFLNSQKTLNYIQKAVSQAWISACH